MKETKVFELTGRNVIVFGNMFSEKNENLNFKNLTLRKLKTSEIEPISNKLTKFEGEIYQDFGNRFETIWYKSNKNDTHHRLKKLPPENFKYRGVEFNKIDFNEDILIHALNLSSYNLFTALILRYVRTDFGEIPLLVGIDRTIENTLYFGDNIFSSYDQEGIDYKMDLLEEVENLYVKIYHLKQNSKFQHIFKSLEDFNYLNKLSNRSSFKVIAYFSIIEALITNNAQDRYQSITQQLKNKIRLLNNRFNESINFRNYFKKVPDTMVLEKIIEILYTYRSNIAHGNQIEFKKQLNILENIDQKTILNFLHELTRKLLIQSLNEPQLFIDLKYC